MSSAIKTLLDDQQFKKSIAWHRHEFKENEVIIQEGEIGSSLFFVESGTLRVISKVEIEKHRHIQPGIWDLKAGDIFGETCLFESHERLASVIGVSSGSVVEIEGNKLSRYLDNNPDMGYLLLKEIFIAMIERLKKANRRVEELFAWGLKVHDIKKEL